MANKGKTWQFRDLYPYLPYIYTALYGLSTLVFVLIFQSPARAESLMAAMVPVVDFLNYVSSLFSRPISEFVILAFALLILAIIITKLIKRQWLGWVTPVANLLISTYLLFFILFGVNYHAPSPLEKLPYTVKAVPYEQLLKTADTIVGEMNIYSDLVKRLDTGSVDFREFYEQNRYISNGYMQLVNNYNLRDIDGLGKPKLARWLEKPMSYLGIAGMHFPFTAESIVNPDSTPLSLPYHTAHEQAHSLGIVREDEAGFMAFLSCMTSKDEQLMYSALFNAYIYVSNAVYSQNYEDGQALSAKVSQNAKEDLIRLNEHLAKYETPVKEVGQSFNNAYLKSNGQSDGVKSYGRIVDLIIAYYE